MGYTDKNTTEKSLYDRVSRLLESYEWSDCSFSVAGKKFKAHRLILGISSPVFKAMFYGPMASENDIIISDIEPDIFQLLINYIYTDKVEISCMDNAFELLYAAKKYLLEHLCVECIEYIVEHLSIDNVVSVLNLSECFQEAALTSSALKMFCEHADHLLPENIDKINCTSLKLILSCNDINISESVLIKFVLDWSKVFCNLNDVPDNIENRQKLLLEKGLIKHLRFFLLPQEDLTDLLSESKLFALKEVIEKQIAFDWTPNGNHNNVTPRNTLKPKQYICHRGTIRSATPLTIDGNNNKITIRIKSYTTVFLNCLCVPTRMSPIINFHNEDPKSYSEQFSVSVISEPDNKVIKFTNFMNTVEYDSNVNIDFSEPCLLKKDTWHKVCFTWPVNGCDSYKYIVGHRIMFAAQKPFFTFEDINIDGSFLESLKYTF